MQPDHRDARTAARSAAKRGAQAVIDAEAAAIRRGAVGEAEWQRRVADALASACLDAWARERGLELALYGLEPSPALADAARRRLPAWAGRIYTGNVSDWTPPQRFDYVRTGLEYVPAGRGPALAARLLRDVVAPGGRLIVGPVSGADVDAAVEAFAAVGVLQPGVAGATDRHGKTRRVVWAGAPAHTA